MIKRIRIGAACLVLCGAQFIGAAHAQQVATIGVGDISYEAKASKSISEQDAQAFFTQSLKTALRDTRKFKLLSKPAMLDLFAERDVSLQGFYEGQYSGVQLEQDGIDYILRASIKELGLYKGKKSGRESVAVASLDLELIPIAAYTKPLNVELRAEHPASYTVRNENDARDLSTQALKEAARRSALALVDHLHPFRVMSINDESQSIKINYGEGLLSIGDELSVYPKPDQEISRTEEFAQDPVATLKIVSVEPKFSYAQILSGYAELERRQKASLVVDN